MEGLGIDLKLLIAQIINFGLFFYVFKRFLAKPFVSFIDEEKQKEAERETSLQKAKKKRSKEKRTGKRDDLRRCKRKSSKIKSIYRSKHFAGSAFGRLKKKNNRKNT